MEHKKWKELVQAGHAFHISRNLMNRREPVRLHDHDFAEILWIAHGHGLHRVNGHAFKMVAGDLVMILPPDRHSVAPIGTSTLNIVNVVIPAGLVTRLRRDYLDANARWFSRVGAYPEILRLSSAELDLLGNEFDWLTHAPRDRQSIATFCLTLMRLIGRPRSPDHPDLPKWLADAMSAFIPRDAVDDPPTLHRFFSLTGRTPEHVARVMRRYLGTTPSSWVNRERIQYAARLLEATDRSVLETALDSGFENLGHFHRLFKEAFGLTPKRYRDRHRRAL
jgi:AraC family transcriptional regulator, dual regulator of chb operon